MFLSKQNEKTDNFSFHTLRGPGMYAIDMTFSPFAKFDGSQDKKFLPLVPKVATIETAIKSSI